MEEKLLYQYVMNYKAYRRGMLIFRLTVSIVAAGACVAFYLILWALGIIVPLAVAAVCAVWIISAYNKEESYAIYDTRLVIRKHGGRISVPLDAITAVDYRRAFYEKDLGTGTVIVSSRVGGKKKKSKLRHVFDAQAGLDFLNKTAENNVKNLSGAAASEGEKAAD